MGGRRRKNLVKLQNEQTLFKKDDEALADSSLPTAAAMMRWRKRFMMKQRAMLTPVALCRQIPGR